ncbi:MAG: DUF3108 domain-containing protein [Bacteriovoracaceae bacterium]|nr:DUF3108 domain-containing protein [Bacteriovoracaceae bacterium]
MKIILLSLFIVASCSSWEQKDFEKELDKPTEEAQPQIIETKKDEKLLEKFEVQPVDEKKVEAKAKAQPKTKVITKKVIKAENSKKKIVQVTTVVPVIKGPPKDYPPELLEVNAKAKKVWDIYRPNHYVDQKIYLDINYLGMTVGKIMVLNKGKKMIDDKEVWHLHAKFKSAPFYSKIYELDDTVDTYVTSDKFLSIRYSLIQRETKQDIDDLQLHDRDRYKTFWFYHRKKSDGSVKDKKEEKPIPYFSIDPFSVLFFYQGLPLKDRDVYEIPIINKGKILILRSVVEGREKISTSKGTRKAIRLHATTKYTGDTLKSGDLYFWFSDDEKRTLLKAQAKIKIGSVTADIVDGQ